MRALSESFINDLKSKDGLLRSIVDRVQLDHTLMLAIRNNYINIYYRGGNILKIQEQSSNSYRAFFDVKYNKEGRSILPAFPLSIRNQDDAKAWVESFPHLKEIMDLFFSSYSKPEREFQQLVARENNFSTISNDSEYFVSDIEHADPVIGARFDMLAIRWLACQRKNGSNCLPALIEMKYGDNALEGKSGLYEHLKDIYNLVTDRDKYSTLLATMEEKFSILDELELLKFNRSSNGTKVKLSVENKPEVILVLANYNPRSKKLLKNVLPKIEELELSEKFDLRFFVASFAGYSMHKDCMVSLTDFRQMLSKLDL